MRVWVGGGCCSHLLFARSSFLNMRRDDGRGYARERGNERERRDEDRRRYDRGGRDGPTRYERFDERSRTDRDGYSERGDEDLDSIRGGRNADPWSQQMQGGGGQHRGGEDRSHRDARGGEGRNEGNERRGAERRRVEQNPSSLEQVLLAHHNAIRQLVLDRRANINESACVIEVSSSRLAEVLERQAQTWEQSRPQRGAHPDGSKDDFVYRAFIKELHAKASTISKQRLSAMLTVQIRRFSAINRGRRRPKDGEAWLWMLEGARESRLSLRANAMDLGDSLVEELGVAFRADNGALDPTGRAVMDIRM